MRDLEHFAVKKNSLMCISRPCIVYRKLSSGNLNCRPFKTFYSIYEEFCLLFSFMFNKHTDHGLLCTPDLVYCFFDFVSHTLSKEKVSNIWKSKTQYIICLRVIQELMGNPELLALRWGSFFYNYCFFLAVGHVLWCTTFTTLNQTAIACRN